MVLKQLLYGNRLVVTYSIILICLLVFIYELIVYPTGVPLSASGAYVHFYTNFSFGLYQPWRMLTAGFFHSGITHLLLNCFTIWIFGRIVEPILGSVRFGLLFVGSVVAGNFFVLLLAKQSAVLGASGGAFGIMGAYLVIAWKMRQDIKPMLILVGINLLISFVEPSISWQGHLGGLIFGLAVPFVLQKYALWHRRAGIAWLVVLPVGLVVLASFISTSGTVLNY